MNDALTRVQRALDFIEAHLFQELPLADIAHAAAWSPFHFHRLFAALTGLTPAHADTVNQVFGRWLPATGTPHRRARLRVLRLALRSQYRHR